MTVEAIINKLETAIRFSDETLEAYGASCTDEEREWLETARERFTEVLNYCSGNQNDLATCYDLYKWICSLYGRAEA